MGNAFFIDMVSYLETVNPLFILAAEIIIAYAMVLIIFKYFGKEGLYSYITMAVIIANIQVLKLVPFPLLPDPIPLGTVVFVSTYLATEIINEHYGQKEAMLAVKLSFLGYLCFVILMTLSLSFTPLTPTEAGEGKIEEYAWAFSVQGHLEALFTPAPSILISSLLAFASSQVINVLVFSKLLNLFKSRFLWFRGIVASSFGTLVDNTVFSLCAFWFLAKEPIALSIVVFSYILGVFWLRFVLALIDMPMLYLSYRFMPEERKQAR